MVGFRSPASQTVRANRFGAVTVTIHAVALLVSGCSSTPAALPSGDAGMSDATAADGAAIDSGKPDAGPAVDPKAGDRLSCTFLPGAKVADTIGDPTLAAARQKIAHVVVLMKENRSFDELLGGLKKAGKSDVEVRPDGWSNPDSNGAVVPVFHAASTCFELDPEHQSTQMVTDWDTGAMDGFIKNAQTKSDDPGGGLATTDGHFVMAELEEADLPFYYFLAKTYALADHYHCAALAGTWANRLYTVAASSYGVKDTGVQFPSSAIKGKFIFDALDAAGVSWGVYSDNSSPLEYALLAEPLTPSKVHPSAQLFTDLAAGTLPQVVFAEGDSTSDTGKALTSNDEHPPADIQVGEAWTKSVYDAVVGSPLWYDSATGKGTALIWTYDENGSFADHVPPPSACKTADVADADAVYFTHLGPRVPFVLASPYSRAGFVSHQTHSHTSITRLIEALWDIGALTERDANSDALLDMFDFTNAAMAKPPTAPPAGKAGCHPDAGP